MWRLYQYAMLILITLVIGCTPERAISMTSSIPTASAEERGTIAFATHSLDDPVSVPGGGWFIATQNANSTNFTEMTTSPHSAYNFKWSPDGSRIAYTLNIYFNVPGIPNPTPQSDNFEAMLKATNEFYSSIQQGWQSTPPIQIMPKLCMVNADGTQDHCFEDIYASQFRWSPDGTQLVLITSAGGLELIAADGTNRRPLMTVHLQTYLGGFSPDGTRLLLADKSLYTIKTDGTDRHDLPVNSTQMIYPAWSPNGAQIAFIGYQEDSAALYVIQADGSDLRKLAFSYNFEDVEMAWSPDSQQIAFVSFPPDNEDFAEHEALWVVDADGQSAPRKLAEIYGEGVNRDELNVSAPVWSPDGERIAFLALYDPDKLSHDIYLINPDGGDLRRMTDDGDLKNNLAWQPVP